MPNEPLNFPANKNIGDNITLNDLNFVWDGTAWNSKPPPSSDFFVADGGNVGIGTTTPAYKMHVITGDSSTDRIQFNTESGESGVWINPRSASIELWDSAEEGDEINSGNPFIDFKTGQSDDFDCRIVSPADNSLEFITGGTGNLKNHFWFTANGEAVIGGATQYIGEVGQQYNAPDPAPHGTLDVRGDLFVSDRIRFGYDHSETNNYPLAQITASRTSSTKDELLISANDQVSIYTGNDYSITNLNDPLRIPEFTVRTSTEEGNRVGIGTRNPTGGKLNIEVPNDEDMLGAFIEGGLYVQPDRVATCLTNFTVGTYTQDFDLTSGRSYVAALTPKDGSVSTDLGGLFIGTDDNNGDENALLIWNHNLESNLEGTGKAGELFRVRTSGDAIVFGNLTVKEKPAFQLVQVTDITQPALLNGSRSFESTYFNQGMAADGGGHILGNPQYFQAPIDGIYHFSASVTYFNGDGVDDIVIIGFVVGNNDDEPNGFYNNTLSAGDINTFINPRKETKPSFQSTYSISRTIKLKSGARVWFNVSNHETITPVRQSFAEFSGHQVG